MEFWLAPMLATQADVVPEGDEWVIEGKYDGWRLVIYRDSEGVIHVIAGRNGSDYTGRLPYIEQALADVLPNDSAIDGELIGKDWNAVQSVMTYGTDEHVPTKLNPALSYVVFDITRLAGEDLRSLPWSERRAKLEALIPGYVYAVQSGAGLISQNGGGLISVSPCGESTTETHEKILALGMEGSVCKRRGSAYSNKRSGAWVKIKPRITAEAKVVGFKPGKKGGEWDGKVGAFEIELLDNGAHTTVKCGTNERHEEATDHPERWLNVVIEFTHFGIQRSGVPKSPQFLRRRDDRAPISGAITPPLPADMQAAHARARKAPKQVGTRKRNYKSMKDDKLIRTIGELRRGEGEAMRKTDTPEADLEVAIALATERGLEVAA